MIHIFYEFQDGPWGGGNQFLKSLQHSFIDKNIYTEKLDNSQHILVNSHHFGSLKRLNRLIEYIQKNKNVKIIHRIDGPVTLIRNRNEGTDNIIFLFNKLFADATIFQSNWCFKNCCKLGWENQNPYKIILNAPNQKIFSSKTKATNKKNKIIATSWSDNHNKGFDVYKWMDENLNWQKYEMTFVGNTPINFNNIKHIPPQNSNELSNLLREHDIFVTASRNDPCSNSLIEALHCGLPALAYHDGGHPEIIGEGGLTFTDNNEIPLKLDQISQNLQNFASAIKLPSMNDVSNEYEDFIFSTVKKRYFCKKESSQYYEQYNKYIKRSTTSIAQKIINKIKKILDQI